MLLVIKMNKLNANKAKQKFNFKLAINLIIFVKNVFDRHAIHFSKMKFFFRDSTDDIL